MTPVQTLTRPTQTSERNIAGLISQQLLSANDLVEIPSPSCYSRFFVGKGRHVPEVSNPNTIASPTLIVESADDWTKITYDAADGRAYGALFEPERVHVFLDRYNALEGYHPRSQEVDRCETRPGKLLKIVQKHLDMLDRLPLEVKRKLQGRL